MNRIPNTLNTKLNDLHLPLKNHFPPQKGEFTVVKQSQREERQNHERSIIREASTEGADGGSSAADWLFRWAI